MSTDKPRENVLRSYKEQLAPILLVNSIAKHQSKTTIGAHNIFLGQVRADDN
jgi:molybdopterin synthase catalytic subunit